MGVWYNETYKILSTEMDYTLTDLDAYLRSADGKYESQPFLFNFARFLAKADKVANVYNADSFLFCVTTL